MPEVKALIPHKLIMELFTKWRTSNDACLSVAGYNPVSVVVQYHYRDRYNPYNGQFVSMPSRHQFEVNLADPEALFKVEQEFIQLQERAKAAEIEDERGGGFGT